MKSYEVQRIESVEGQMALPLPGLHPVLSWQLNATVHQATGLCKWVSIVREPSDHVEILRQFQELTDYTTWRRGLEVNCSELVKALGYLSGLGSGV